MKFIFSVLETWNLRSRLRKQRSSLRDWRKAVRLSISLQNALLPGRAGLWCRKLGCQGSLFVFFPLRLNWDQSNSNPFPWEGSPYIFPQDGPFPLGWSWGWGGDVPERAIILFVWYHCLLPGWGACARLGIICTVFMTLWNSCAPGENTGLRASL